MQWNEFKFSLKNAECFSSHGNIFTLITFSNLYEHRYTRPNPKKEVLQCSNKILRIEQTQYSARILAL